MTCSRQATAAINESRGGTMFSVLGLGEAEERTYRHLVGLPSAGVGELASALGLDLPVARTALGSLETQGLVVRSAATPDRFTASPPELALGSMIVERQQEIRRAELELHSLNDLFRQAAAGRVGTDIIDIVRGPQAVAQHFAQLQRGARRTIAAMVKSEVAVVDAEQNLDEEVAIQRGVEYRVIVESQAFNRPGFAEQAALTAASGEEIRVAENLPLRMLIADGELALLPLHAEGSEGAEVGALLLRPSGLLDAMGALFTLCWQRAQPTYLPAGAAGPAGELDEVDQHLLVLLRAGITDQAMAAQLGISLRTVQRRLQQLMSRAQARTRFQLGISAITRGWLPDSSGEPGA